jgi:hypothetical protein
MYFGMFGSIFLLAQFFQTVQGYSPFGSGLRFLPWTLAPMFIAPLAGALSDKIPAKNLIGVGLAMQAGALAWTAVLKIAFSDGSSGVLTVGCHGPGGAPRDLRGDRHDEGIQDVLRGRGPRPGRGRQPHALPRSLALEAVEHEQGSRIGCPVRLTRRSPGQLADQDVDVSEGSIKGLHTCPTFENLQVDPTPVIRGFCRAL